MYAFLRRPKWILSHLFVASLIAATIVLGLWQLNRLDERRSTNDEIDARLEEAVAPLASLTSADADEGVGAELRFRLVQVSGTYVPEDEVLVLNRTFSGAPGYWVLTPLLQPDGTAVVINRGWIPFRFAPGEPRPESAAPTGQVTVVGMVRETVEPEGIQSADPDGRLDALARPDLLRYQEQLSYDIWPVLVQAEQPESTEFPIRLERPELDEGPHLGYAVQWFIFATIGLIGYPLVLRRIAHSEGRDGRHSDIPVDYL